MGLTSHCQGRARRSEFFEMDVCGQQTELREMLAPALDHLGRPAQIYVHVAVIQRARAKMIGDMAGQRMLASTARTGGVIGELRDTRCECLDPFDLDKIGVIAHAVNEPHGLIVSTPRSQMLEHRQDRPNAGPSRKEQDRPSRRAKVETTERAVENEPVTRLGLSLEIGAHLAARHIADQEGRHIGARRRGEGIGPLRIRSGDIDILPRQEHRKRTFQRLDRQPYDKASTSTISAIVSLGLTLHAPEEARMSIPMWFCGSAWQQRTYPSTASASLNASSI